MNTKPIKEAAARLLSERRTGKKKKRFSPSSIAAVALGICILSAAGSYAVYEQIAGKPLSVLDDSRITFTGYSGSGSVSPSFHPEESAMTRLQQEIDEAESSGRTSLYLKQLKETIVCGFDRSSGLSNGDVVTYACTVDRNTAREAGFRADDTQKSYRVEGLPEYAEVDPFDGVTAEWIWKNGVADLHILVPENLQELGISITWLEEDSTHVRLHTEADEQSMKENGILLTRTETVFETGRKPFQIESLAELNDSDLKNILQEASAALDSELAACGNTLNSSRKSITITGHDEGILRRTGDGFSVTFTLEAEDDGSWFAWLSGYQAVFRGTVYRDSSGIAHFSPSSTHSCRIDGLLGNYTLEENPQS